MKLTANAYRFMGQPVPTDLLIEELLPPKLLAQDNYQVNLLQLFAPMVWPDGYHIAGYLAPVA